MEPFFLRAGSQDANNGELKSAGPEDEEEDEEDEEDGEGPALARAGAAEEEEEGQNPARTLAMDDAAAGADDGGGGGGTGFAAEPRTKRIRHRRRHRQLGGCHPLGYCYCYIVAWRSTAI